ncbi:hypothetical protein FOA52_009536 [Chlamydomonas sp. UWO 241]|nr:hypothetical protein FOA52_009536 [Chlamydomonas sp. UWO 241]
MESTGQPGRIQVSEATHTLLSGVNGYEKWCPTGGVQCKGKGCMQTFLWHPPVESSAPSRSASRTSQHMPAVAAALEFIRVGRSSIDAVPLLGSLADVSAKLHSIAVVWPKSARISA